MNLRALAATAVSLVLLAACSGAPGANNANPQANGGEGDQMKTLNLWMPPLAIDTKDQELWDDIVKPWEEKTGVDVKVTIIPWDAYETKYLTGVSSGNGPDVGYMYGEMMGDYIVKNQLVAMDDMITPEQKDNLLFLNNGQINGKQYAMPFVVGGARVLYYNKDLLDKAGLKPPTTWDEFVSASKTLLSKGIKPFTAPWGDPSRGVMNGTFIPWVWQAGGDLFSSDGKTVAFDSPEAIKAAQYLKSLKDDGILDKNVTGLTMDTATKEFQSGKVAFTVDSDQNAPKWDEAKLNWGYEVSLKDQQQATMVASDSLVLLKGCKVQETCYDLISFLTQGDQMAKLHKVANFPPIGKDETNTYDKRLAPIYDDTSILHPLPVVANGVPAYNALYKNLQQMLNGEKSPEQAMRDAAAEGNAALKQGQ